MDKPAKAHKKSIEIRMSVSRVWYSYTIYICLMPIYINAMVIKKTLAKEKKELEKAHTNDAKLSNTHKRPKDHAFNSVADKTMPFSPLPEKSETC